MDYDVDGIRKLAARYFDGETDDKDEAILRAWAEDAASGKVDVPEDLKSLAMMLGGFRSLSGERMSGDRAFRDTGKVRSSVRRLTVWFTVAAALAAVAYFSNRPVYGYDSDGKPITDKKTALAQAACFERLADLETSLELAGGIFSLLGETSGEDDSE